MRMHTHGKCTSNIILGALTVFCVIVLYNYWTVSTLNHDLILKINSLEDRTISMSKSNDALQANLEKVQEIKDKVEGNLKKEQIIDEKAKEEISIKDHMIKSLQNDLENSKQASQNCREEFATSESKIQGKEKEVSELKAKIVSLEAQLVEKTNKVSRMEKDLQDARNIIAAKSGSSSTSSSPGGKSVDVARHDVQPVLMNDPAVPYPNGWMDKHHVSKQLQSVVIKSEGDNGIERVPSMGKVIVFDPPNSKPLKARFSVLDPPKNEMKPEGGISPGKPPSLQKPMQQHEETFNGGEDFGQQAGVLQAPAHRGDQHNEAQNLDAAEDDGDRPLKDDFQGQDDQSPDGALSQKEVFNAIQAPDINQNEIVDHRHPQTL